MASLQAQSLIAARGSTVWEILTDAGNLPVRGSGITEISGEIRNGVLITIGTRARKRSRLRVEQIPGTVMTWSRRMPPLYSFVRTFTLTPGAGVTLLVVSDELRGPLRGLLGSPWAFTEEQLRGFVAEVKHRAELFR